MAGTQQSLRDYMVPFKIASDTAPFILLLDGAKSISCLANLACDCTRKMGLTELTMEGHDLTAKQKDNHCPKDFFERLHFDFFDCQMLARKMGHLHHSGTM